MKKILTVGKIVLLMIIISTFIFPLEFVKAQENPGPIEPPILIQPPAPAINPADTRPPTITIDPSGAGSSFPSCYPYCEVGPNGLVNGYRDCDPYCDSTPSGAQVNAVNNGITSSGAGPAAGVGKGVQSAASCISAAKVVRIAKEALVQANPASKIKVSVTTPDVNARSGELTEPSFDSIGYCLLNAIVEYVANATIAWANSGFNGAPAFLADPKSFFLGLADSQVSGFLKDFNTNGAGLNIPPEFRGAITQGLLQGYTGATGRSNSYGSRGQDGLAFLSNIKPFGDSYLQAGAAMSQRVNQQAGYVQQQLQQGGGFLSPSKPGEVVYSRDAQGNLVTTRQNPQITTPSSIVKDVLGTRVNGGFNRLLSADKFDQVVSSLVNALIKLVLSKVLQQ